MNVNKVQRFLFIMKKQIFGRKMKIMSQQINHKKYPYIFYCSKADIVNWNKIKKERKIKGKRDIIMGDRKDTNDDSWAAR